MKWLKEYTFQNSIDEPVRNKVLVIDDDTQDRDHRWTLLATMNATITPDGGLSIDWCWSRPDIVIPRVVELSDLPLYISWPYKTNAFTALLQGDLCLNSSGQ